jgi:hypothetical protein
MTGAAAAVTSPAGTMHRPLSRVVVTGRDADLWLCVSAISRALGPAGVSVVAIELPSRLQPSHISATLPPLEALHAKLGIKESALIRATGGSFSFGQNFVPDWSRGTGTAGAGTSPAGNPRPLAAAPVSFMPGAPVEHPLMGVRSSPAG